MFSKIKSKLNKKYTTIALYVVGTFVIMFILGSLIASAGYILSGISSGLRYLFKILTPLIIGIIIAYVLDPVVELFEKMYKKIKIFKFKKDKSYRNISVLSAILIVLIIVIMLIYALVFSITGQITDLNMDIGELTRYINGFSESLKEVEIKLSKLNIEYKFIEDFATKASKSIMTYIQSFGNNIGNYAITISSHISNAFFGIIISIYLLLDKEHFINYIKKFFTATCTPKIKSKIWNLWVDFDNIFSGYIRGLLLDMLFMCTILSVCLSVIGIKFGVLIGIFAGICNLIPYFGPIAAFGGTIFFGLLNAQYNKVLIAIVVLLIVQQIDANVMEPKFLGKNVSLHPVIILVSLLIGADLAGVIGMILAVPVAAFCKLFFNRFINKRFTAKQ